MTPYHEEENDNGKLFNKDLMRILFGYVLRYKKLLFLSVACVVVITAATLTAPLLGKIIFDRYIIKQGYVIDVSKLQLPRDKDVQKSLKKAVSLRQGNYFLFQSQAGFFSKKQIGEYKAVGLFSKEKYTLVESPSFIDDAARNKFRLCTTTGDIVAFGDSLYCIKDNALHRFTVKELVQIRKSDSGHVGLLVLFMLSLYTIQFLASYAQIVLLMRLSQYSMRDLRKDLFNHVLSLELAYFDKNPIGKLVNRVGNDIEALNEMFSSVLITLVQDILILAGITGIMFFVNIYLACAVAITFPLLVVVTMLFRIKARDAYRAIRTKLADLNAFLNENITGIRIVQIFVQQAKQFQKFTTINNELYAANIRQLYIYAIFRPLIDFCKWFAIAAVIFLGCRLLLGDMLSYGVVLMFIAYVGSFFEPIGDLSEKFDTLQSATAAGEKVMSVFNADCVKEYETGGAASGRSKAPANRFQGEIVFDDVWFGYAPGEWVLKGVSFSVNPHQMLALVGGTGSGKTTIISLLSRLYPIQKGKITIDGVDISAIELSMLRKNIATVMQDVFLFSRTLRENIILFNDLDRQRFKDVSAITHLDGFISRLPKRDEEPVMERGATFSAGERQLIAFARALYADPSILVLDEATSNIDTETEQLIQDAIRRLITGRTSIVVAHRLSTVQNANKILVLDKGCIVEQGDHASLLARQGMYYDLYKMQFSGV